MKLNRITGRNIKGRDFELLLGPAVTVIAGRNATGKSAIADAVRLALTGAIPGLGKQGGALFSALADRRNGPLQAVVEFDDGTKSGVTLTADAKGSVSSDIRIPIHVGLSGFLADPASFWSLTASERVKAVMQASGAGTLRADELYGVLAGVDGRAVAKRSIRDALIEQMTSEVGRVFRDSAPDQVPKVLADAITGWKASAAEERSQARQMASEIRATVIDMTAKPVLDSEVAEAEQKLAELMKAQGELESLMRAPAEAERRSEQITRRAAEMREKIEAANARIRTLSDMDLGTVPDSLDARIRGMQKEVADLFASIGQQESVQSRCRSLLLTLEQATRCPVCGSAETVEAARKSLKAEEEEAAAKIAELHGKRDELAEHLEEMIGVENERSLLLSQREGRDTELESLRASVAQMSEMLADALQADLGPKVAADADRIRQLEEIVTLIPEAEQAVADVRARHQAWAARVTATARRDGLEGRMLEAECRASVYSGAVDAVSEFLQVHNNKAFTSVLNRAECFTKGVLRSRLEWRDGELGRCVVEADAEDGCRSPFGAWIPWRAFSGTEQAIALCALSVALTGSGSFRLAIVDELGRMTKDVQARFVRNLADAIKAGLLDQAIVILADGELNRGAFLTQEAAAQIGEFSVYLIRVGADSESSPPEPEKPAKRKRAAKPEAPGKA